MKTVACGLIYLALGTLLGAFGAHAIAGSITEQAMTTYHTAHQYQVTSAFAMIALGLCQSLWPSVRLTGALWTLFIGSLIFSGSLYSLALTGVRIWGAVTPIGGVLTIGSLCWAAWKLMAHKATTT